LRFAFSSGKLPVSDLVLEPALVVQELALETGMAMVRRRQLSKTALL
jgi:hypothetical protein